MSKLARLARTSPQLVGSLTNSTQLQQTRDLHEALNTPKNVTKYGGKYRAVMIPGDGIGPEMMFHIKESFRHVRAPVDFEEVPLNSKNVSESLIEQAVVAVKRNGACLKGNIETDHMNPTAFSVNLALRHRLDLFANVVRCKSLPNVKTRHGDIDIMIIRENTEGEYAALEHESVPGVVESLKIISRPRSIRIAEYAFARAKQDGRKKVTVVHKANIMKLGDGLFVECCREVSKRYPDIKFETMIVDNTCMQLVARPQQFDLMVMPNLYGNIVANICTGLVGGAGLVAGSNYSADCGVFEKGTRNSGKGIAGLNSANPCGMLFAGANLLRYIGLKEHASVIRNATINTLGKHNVKTADIGGTATTTEFMKYVIEEIQQNTPEIGIRDPDEARSSASVE